MPAASDFKRKIFDHFGPPEVFRWEPCAIRSLTPDEVLIRVKFIGVNYADIIARRGYYKWAEQPPICPGFEVSGEIIGRGEAVTLPVGTKVLAVTRFGGYAEAVIAEQSRVWEIPERMSLEEAAAMPAVYLTAYHSLMEVMRIQRGGNRAAARPQLAKRERVEAHRRRFHSRRDVSSVLSDRA
jgi:NADPH2:quinone reductase